MSTERASRLTTSAARRVATVAGVSGLASRAVSIAAMLAAVPIALGALGEERFGLWMLITSLVAAFGFLDLGLANGMLTSLAQSSGAAAARRVEEIVATGVLMLAALGALLLVLALVLVPTVDWQDTFNVSGAVHGRELTMAMMALAAMVAIGVPASAVQRIYFGLQRGAQANFWQAVGAVLSLLGVFVAARSGAGLPGFVIATVGGPVVGWLLGGIALLVGRDALAVPTPGAFRSDEARQLQREGLLYFALQGSAAVAFYSDNALLAAAAGTSELAAFSTTARLFGVIFTAASIMAFPLWAAFGLAVGQGEHDWVRRQFRTSLVRTVGLAAIASAALAFAFQPIAQLWLGAAAPRFETSLIVWFAVWTVVQSCGTVASSLLNAVRAVRFQLLVALVFTPVCLLLKWQLAKHVGPVGIVIAASASYLALVIVPYAWYLRRSGLLRT